MKNDTDMDTILLKGEIIGDPKENVKNHRYFSYIFDGDLSTYFLRPRKMEPWVGLDFGKPQRIVKVRYCPRSDTNFIEIGNLYELLFWKNNDWESLGKKIAQTQELVYKDVPSNGLYLLRNLSGGKEERIFTYENNKQVWW